MQSPFQFKQIQTLNIRSDQNPRVSIESELMVITANINSIETVITVPVDCLIKNKDGSEVKPFPLKSQSKVSSLRSKQIQSPRIKNRFFVNSGKKRQGELNGMAKLTEKQVVEIKEILKDKSYISTFTNKGQFYDEVAKAYNVTRACILAIKTNTTWRHVSV